MLHTPSWEAHPCPSPMSRACSTAPDGYVLPYRTPKTAWEHITALCEVAGVVPKGMHSLHHSAGTRLYVETGDLEETARHLGHAKLDTTRIYAKWNDRKLREASCKLDFGHSYPFSCV